MLLWYDERHDDVDLVNDHGDCGAENGDLRVAIYDFYFMLVYSKPCAKTNSILF